jgi:hypothetical protein
MLYPTPLSVAEADVPFLRKDTNRSLDSFAETELQFFTPRHQDSFPKVRDEDEDSDSSRGSPQMTSRGISRRTQASRRSPAASRSPQVAIRRPGTPVGWQQAS